MKKRFFWAQSGGGVGRNCFHLYKTGSLKREKEPSGGESNTGWNFTFILWEFAFVDKNTWKNKKWALENECSFFENIRCYSRYYVSLKKDLDEIIKKLDKMYKIN